MNILICKNIQLLQERAVSRGFKKPLLKQLVASKVQGQCVAVDLFADIKSALIYISYYSSKSAPPPPSQTIMVMQDLRQVLADCLARIEVQRTII